MSAMQYVWAGAGVVLAVMLVQLLADPLRYAAILAIRTAAGAIALSLLNIAGGLFGLHLPVNPVSAAIAGLLGMPGILLLGALQQFV